MARNVREEFAERFKLALDEAGLRDMKDLATALGVTAQAVRKWREGDSIPTAEHAPLLAEKLGVRRAWLLDGELPMRPRVDGMSLYRAKMNGNGALIGRPPPAKCKSPP